MGWGGRGVEGLDEDAHVVYETFTGAGDEEDTEGKVPHGLVHEEGAGCSVDPGGVFFFDDDRRLDGAVG